jgi:hypothetical protein
MLENCRIKKFSPSEYETLFPLILSLHAPLHDDILVAYAFSARISPGLPHCSRSGTNQGNQSYLPQQLAILVYLACAMGNQILLCP